MATASANLAPTPRRAAALLPDGVAGMLQFIAIEAMFFAGLASAFVIARAGATIWPPANQPRLPVEATAVNTAVLLLSGVALALGHRAAAAGDARLRRWLAVALALGTTFVAVQGVEWARLIGFGLTLRSSSYGAFFYLIVGAHALHAMAALGGLGYAYVRLREGRLRDDVFWAAELFWYFVVAVWPVLYVTVYLS